MSTIDIELFSLLRGYSSLTHPKSLRIPSNLSLTELNGFFLSKLLLDPHLQQYPPSQQYQKTFWKWAIQYLENLSLEKEGDDEINSRIYEHYLELSGPAAQPADSSGIPSQSYLTYYWVPPAGRQDGHINLEQSVRITLLESRTTIENGTTGLRTWKASFVLADYLLNNSELVRGKRVLELGSGVGFLGIVVAGIQQPDILPGTSLCLTDVNEQVLSRCCSNVSLPCNVSSFHPRVQCRALDWLASSTGTTFDLDLPLDEGGPDLVLGADIVFDPSLIPPLVGMLKSCLSTTIENRPKKALIALTTRNRDTTSLFINSVQGIGSQIEEMIPCHQRTHFLESFSVDDGSPVQIFSIRMLQ